MECTTSTYNKKIIKYVATVEEKALEQANNVLHLPSLVTDVILLPDVHVGFGMPIGCVMGLYKAISPNAVGKDIACSVSAVKTNLNINDDKFNLDKIKQIMKHIRLNIPLGVGGRRKQPLETHDSLFSVLDAGNYPVSKSLLRDSKCKIGTLGSGNHFIEFQKNSQGYLWLMIHSGSRNLGAEVANHYDKLAQAHCKRTGYGKMAEDKLSCLPTDSQAGKDYIDEMRFCEQYAQENHRIMKNIIKAAFLNEFYWVSFTEELYTKHNYAEEIEGNVWVHRKGAVKAENSLVIIPGSQGTASYICKGKNNPSSLYSCSHGAGRLMSRTKAKDELVLEDEIRKMDEKGILHALMGKKQLDEAPSAYKDIDMVIQLQVDAEIIEVVEKLEPIACIKGD